MTRPVDDLALRKQLLLARSTLCRLKLRHEYSVMRNSLTWRNAGVAVAQSHTARSTAFLLALAIMGNERMRGLLAFAGRAMAIARVSRFAMEWLRKPPADAEGSQPQ
jgi:hypothetical protein